MASELHLNKKLLSKKFNHIKILISLSFVSWPGTQTTNIIYIHVILRKTLKYTATNIFFREATVLIYNPKENNWKIIN